MSTPLRHLSLATVSALCLALPLASMAGHSWGPYHWARTSNPFTLKLGDNLNSTWDPHLATATSDWSLSGVLDTTIVAGKTRPKSCRPSAGRVEVCNAAYGGTGWLGVAQIWISGVHITQGTVKLNDSYFNSPPYNTSPWRLMVTCQEVGHTFGLNHQDEDFYNPNLGTCMDYTADPDGPPSNEHPNAHDYEQLAIIYAHTDASTTVGQATANGKAPPAMMDVDLAGPAQWGRLVHQSRDGRLARYEADFGGGFKVFTFVIWAK